MTEDSKPCWVVRADRRELALERVQEELRFLEETLEVQVEFVTSEDFLSQPDGGAFRDFVPVARVRAASQEELEAMVEELILEFGFLVDFLKQEPQA